MIVASVLFIAVALVALWVARGWCASFDRAGLLTLGGLVSDHAQLARAVTRLGDPAVRVALVALSAIALVIAHRWRDALFLAITAATGSLVVSFLKFDLGRARPALLPHLTDVHDASFPSGHAANTAIVYGALAIVLRETRAGRWLATLAAAIALLVGLSRIGLAVHWPSDVLAGWLFGAGWLFLAHALARKFGRRD